MAMAGIAAQETTTAARARNGRGPAHAARAAGRGAQRNGTLAPLIDSSALELIADAVVILDPKGVIAGWNAGAEQLFGYTSREMLGSSLQALCAEGLAPEVERVRVSALRGKRIEPFETERVCKGGKAVPVRVTAIVVHDHEDAVAGVAVLFFDLSPRRRIEAELKASEERYRSVVDALSEGVLVHDPHGEIVALNGSATRILGLDADELRGASSFRPLLPVIHEDGSPFAGEDHPGIVSLRTGEAQDGVVMGVVQRDGATRWLSANSRPLVRPGEAKPYAAVASFSDITEHRRTLEELEGARLEDLKRLALVSEYRDDETNRHTERVARTAQLLAAELGLDAEMVWTIARAAPLHDVGKVGIPDSILLKPGRLTDDEFTVMMTHTAIGGRILGESDFRIVRMAMEIALTHHERWDGGGYPAGLHGEEIPMSGRIVAVADAYDAMTHDRPYKEAGSIEEATIELERCSGSQFDPDVVEAFLALPYDTLVDRD